MPREIQLFAPYAHKDRAAVERRRDRLEPHFAILNGFRISPWIDHMIEPGVPWDDAIRTALAGADLGLLLSPALLASSYIARVELPVFIELQPAPPGGPALRITRPLLPVLLRDLPDATIAYHRGLEQLQVFKDQARRSFTRTRGPTSDAFALQFATALHAKLRRHYPVVAA